MPESLIATHIHSLKNKVCGDVYVVRESGRKVLQQAGLIYFFFSDNDGVQSTWITVATAVSDGHLYNAEKF